MHKVLQAQAQLYWNKSAVCLRLKALYKALAEWRHAIKHATCRQNRVRVQGMLGIGRARWKGELTFITLL